MAQIPWPVQKLLENYPRNRTALVLLKKDGTKVEYSWINYGCEVAAVAEALESLGVKQGDFVAIAVANLPESYFALLGIIAVGAIPVPINIPLLKENGQKELQSIIENCRPKLILTNSCLSKYLTDFEHKTIEELPKLLNQPAEDLRTRKFGIHDPNSLFIMPYTSGTTGKSKGVMLSAEGILNRVAGISKEVGATEDDRLFSYLSLGHISELVATFFGQLLTGYTVYFTEYAGTILGNREEFRAALPKILQTIKPTIFLAVPKIWSNMRKEIEKKLEHLPIDLSKHKYLRKLLTPLIIKKIGFGKTKCFISAGSKLSLDDRLFFLKFGIFIDDIYGQTETGGPLTLNGKVVGDTKVSLTKNNEIVVSGPNIMLGYYNDLEATSKVLADGRYYTGDIGKLFKNQDRVSVYYEGRINDSFKLAHGEFVPSSKIEELEGKIRNINGVDEAMICGDGKPYLVALIFSSNPTEELRTRLANVLPTLEQSLFRIENFAILNLNSIEITPTLKLKRSLLIKKFAKEISQL